MIANLRECHAWTVHNANHKKGFSETKFQSDVYSSYKFEMTQALKIKYLLQLPPYIYMSSFKTVHKEKCTLSPKKIMSHVMPLLKHICFFEASPCLQRTYSPNAYMIFPPCSIIHEQAFNRKSHQLSWIHVTTDSWHHPTFIQKTHPHISIGGSGFLQLVRVRFWLDLDWLFQHRGWLFCWYVASNTKCFPIHLLQYSNCMFRISRRIMGFVKWSFKS